MTKGTVNCYVPSLLAQGQHKWPGFPDSPFRTYKVRNAELEDIHYDVYWRLVETDVLAVTVLTLDDWHNLFYAERLAKALEY